MIAIPDYTITSQLHDGIETNLYGGYRDRDRLPVVIKYIKPECADPRNLAKLRHEYSILSEIDVPGVRKALALEKVGPTLALVMHAVDATPLNEHIQARVLDLEATLQIAVAITDTLAALHRHSIIHKDIKPHNILCNLKTKAVYLIDFGIATRLMHETQKVAPPDSLEGTLAYLSPEQTGRMNRVIDRRSDFYSLGVTLYEMLTGEPPFKSEDPMQLIYSHIARTPVPPHDRAPNIPKALSALVMKLLAKTAEDRYQDAVGLKADLEECLRQWRQKRRIEDFQLGQHDRSAELRIPQKLYGREGALRDLLSAFGRVQKGNAELLLIAGQPGVGKSALVQELHKSIAHTGGYYAAGKFDQLSRSTPYLPIAQALSGLVRQLLCEKAEVLARWREQILAVLGKNGQILISLIPELQLIIGPQPAVPVLGPTESQNRFNLVFQNFIRIFASRRHPLILVLDDLQWADQASLQLLRQLLTDPEQRYLFVIGAFRDNEVTSAHLLNLEMAAWRKAEVTMHELSLQPLNDVQLRDLIKDALSCDVQTAARLGSLINLKTHGNPLFVIQFLTMLYEEKLLYFEPIKGTWVWDEAAVVRQQVTDNVVDLMIGKLRKLTVEAQRLLTLAACVGHEFELRMLMQIGGQSLAATYATLWPTLQAGLVIPLDSEYRLLPSTPDGLTAPASAELGAKVRFRFFHDRMRQAAYELLPAEQRPAVHLSIGRFLQAIHGEHLSGAKLFDVADHLNHAQSLIHDPAERLQLSRLNLTAGQQAKASTAYLAAASYCRHAVELLPEGAWQKDHDLCFQAYEERAECEYLSSNFEQAEKHFDVLLSQARSDLERARVYDLQLVLHLALGRLEQGVALGQRALKLFDIELPMTPPEQFALFQNEMMKVGAQLAAHPFSKLLHAPVMQDPAMKMLMQLLMHIHPHAFLLNPLLAQIISTKQVGLSLDYGNAPASSFAYAVHSVFVANQLGQYRVGYGLAKVALELSERFDSALLRARTMNVFGTFLSFNCQPVSESIELMRRSMRISLEVGDFQTVSYNCIHIALIRLATGDELPAVRAEVGQFLALCQRTRARLGIVCLQLGKQFLSALEGHTNSNTSLDDGSFGETSFLYKLNEERLMVAVMVYYELKLQLCFLYEDYVSAFAMAQEADQRAVFGAGAFCTIEGSFYIVLTALSLLRTASTEQRALYEPMLQKNKARLKALAAECPHNFSQQVLLIDAETAALEGRTIEAMKLYDEAVSLAQQNNFPSYEALGNELAAKFYLRLGLTKVAGMYMGQAHLCYVRWGATAKATQLADTYGYMLLQVGQAVSGAPAGQGAGATAVSTRTIVGGLFDITALMRATQSISMEIMLDKVLNQVLRIVLTTAGGQRGFLVLMQDDRLVISATTTNDQEQVELGMNRALDDEPNISRSIVQYVAQSNDAVVLADASRDSRFSSDPYVAQAHPKSVLCMPLAHQGRPVGVMYLENNLAVGAFRADRIELLRMLCSQAAIAVENARLYSRVQAITDQLRQSNTELNQTNQRLLSVTEQLEQSNKELLESNQRLEVELTERARAEEERADLQNTIIQTQRARLAELSTPLIPLTDKIMVLPLIGSVDNQRADQVLETVLHGSAMHQTDFVIIDITGLRHVDTNAANSLIKAASALRLLGSEAVLTGIRAEVAQTLVSLGIDLGKIVTRSTLQSGIAYAISRSSSSGKNPIKG